MRLHIATEWLITMFTAPRLLHWEGGTSVFGNIPADCVIHVPAASLLAYQAATNWSTHAAKMVGDL